MEFARPLTFLIGSGGLRYSFLQTHFSKENLQEPLYGQSSAVKEQEKLLDALKQRTFKDKSMLVTSSEYSELNDTQDITLVEK